MDRLKKELEGYFTTNSDDTTSEATVWEAHKAYIRGILIAIGAEKKKRRRSRRKGESLYKEIHVLEQRYKNTGDELKDLIEQENRALFYWLKKERYQRGDMSSKY